MTLLHIEVLTESNQKPEIIINFLMETFCSVQTHSTITENLPDQIKQIRICESSPQQPLISLSSAELRIYQFQYRKDSFPLEIYSDLWDSLVFDNEIKSKLINFILTGFLFADLRVNPQIISVNKLILLYGPPGTGKTSLCRALVQKIAIRFKERFQDGGKLIELQSGKLLSKYFSESNKLVLAQFREIQELLSNNNQFVVLLMDEVESLAACRNKSLGGGEPMDAIRAVNCILSEIDKLKQFPNVFILATSNVTKVIDDAFLDRADLSLLIDIPTTRAVYTILRNGIHELIKCGLIQDRIKLSLVDNLDLDECQYSKKLWDICQACHGLSGRKLDRLLFVVHAMYFANSKKYLLEDFLSAMELYIGE